VVYPKELNLVGFSEYFYSICQRSVLAPVARVIKVRTLVPKMPRRERKFMVTNFTTMFKCQP